MLLGKRVLGEEGAASEAAKQQGGAVVAVRLGPRVLGTAATVTATAPADKAPARARPVRASGNRTAAPQARVVVPDEAPRLEAEPPGPADVGFSEGEVEAMLVNDPNIWDVVLDAESKRPEGPRVAVAALLLAAADRATEKPIPAIILAELERLTQPAG